MILHKPLFRTSGPTLEAARQGETDPRCAASTLFVTTRIVDPTRWNPIGRWDPPGRRWPPAPFEPLEGPAPALPPGDLFDPEDDEDEAPGHTPCHATPPRGCRAADHRLPGTLP